MRAGVIAIGLWVGLVTLVIPLALPAQNASSPPAAPAAQGASDLVVPPAQVIVIDYDRAFTQSLFGRRVVAEYNIVADALQSENSAITGELEAEEEDLTRRRPDMEPDAFRAEAEAFDAKVQQIRQTQDAKERTLQSAISEAQDIFASTADPIIIQLMQARGASVLLDRRSVRLFAQAVDITDEAVAAINATIGDGADVYTVPQLTDAPGDN